LLQAWRKRKDKIYKLLYESSTFWLTQVRGFSLLFLHFIFQLFVSHPWRIFLHIVADRNYFEAINSKKVFFLFLLLMLPFSHTTFFSVPSTFTYNLLHATPPKYWRHFEKVKWCHRIFYLSSFTMRIERLFKLFGWQCEQQKKRGS
jgi:hypothetical protein